MNKTLYVLITESFDGCMDTPLVFKQRGQAIDFVLKDLMKSTKKKFSTEELAEVRDILGSDGWYKDEDLCFTYSIYESELQE